MDGPVIVKVCGQQVNGTSSDVQPPQNPATVCDNTLQQSMITVHSPYSPQASGLLPKIQHVSSANSFVPGALYQLPPVPHRETYVLPEHRFLGQRSNGVPIPRENMARHLQATNVTMPSSGTSNLPMNCENANMAGQQRQLPRMAVPWTSNIPVYAQQNGTGPVHRIATVRPQQIIPSPATINIPTIQNAAQQTVQVPQPQPSQLSQPSQVQPAAINHQPDISRVADRATLSVHQSSPNLLLNNGNGLPTSQSESTKTQVGNVPASSKEIHIGGNRGLPSRGPVTGVQTSQEDQAQTKEGVTYLKDISSVNIPSSHYRIRGFHELLPDSYPNVKNYKADSGASWGEGSAARHRQRSRFEGEASPQLSGHQTSQEVPVSRRRRPPVNFPFCPPDSNQGIAAGNQTAEQAQGDLTPSLACQQTKRHSQLHSEDQASASDVITGVSVQGLAPQMKSALPSAYSQQQCLPVTQPSNNSQFSILKEVSANQMASSGPNYQYRYDVPGAHTNFPPTSVNLHGKKPFEVPPSNKLSQVVPHQAGLHKSPAPLRTLNDHPVSIHHQ